jgi:hypothetical protein
VKAIVIVLVVVGLPLAGYLAYASWKKEQARRQQLFQWATTNGYTYAVEDDSWCARWSATPFGEGDHRRARDVITGSVPAGATGTRQFAAFDYSFQTHSTDGQGHTTTTTHNYTVASLSLPAYLPTLQVTPENVMTRLGNALGLDDIELESEDFNRRFRVHARDAKFASDVLSPRTMEALLAGPMLSWRIDGTDIVCWHDGKLVPATIGTLTSTLGTVVDGIPSFVWKDHGTAADVAGSDTTAPQGGSS